MIYVITSIYFKYPHVSEDARVELLDAFGSYSHRVFGYFLTLTDAQNAVDNNSMDMHECLYNLLVIEEIPPGIHSSCKKEWWHEWDAEKNKWTPLKDKPESLKNTVNFSIG